MPGARLCRSWIYGPVICSFAIQDFVNYLPVAAAITFSGVASVRVNSPVNASFVQDDHAVRKAQHLGQFGRDQHDRHALASPAC